MAQGSETATPVGALTELDRKTLAMYCECVARYERAQAALLKDGDTFIQPNGVPGSSDLNITLCGMPCRSCGNLLPCSACLHSARMRLQIPEPEHPDEMEALLD